MLPGGSPMEMFKDEIIKLNTPVAGFCMGVAELIPGISGSTIAVIFKIYPNLNDKY
jgi:uncharacterized membrane protein